MKLSSVTRLIYPFGGAGASATTPLPCALITGGMGLGWLVTGGFGWVPLSVDATVTPPIRRAIVAALKADPGVSALAGGRVFPLFVPESESRPSLCYQLVEDVTERQLDGANGVSRAVFELASVTRTLADGEALAEAVRLAIDGLTANFPVAGTTGLVVLETTLLGEEDRSAVDAADGSARPFLATVFTYALRYRRPAPVRP
jgi:hypothetical protein